MLQPECLRSSLIIMNTTSRKQTPAPDFSDLVFIKAKYFQSTWPSKKLSEKNLGPYLVIAQAGTHFIAQAGTHSLLHAPTLQFHELSLSHIPCLTARTLCTQCHSEPGTTSTTANWSWQQIGVWDLQNPRLQNRIGDEETVICYIWYTGLVMKVLTMRLLGFLPWS